MLLFASDGYVELTAFVNDLSLKLDVMSDNFDKSHEFGLAVRYRDHIHAVSTLEIGEFEKRSESFFGICIAAQSYDGSHAVSVRLVVYLLYKSESVFFLFSQFVYLGQKQRFVDLIRELRDNYEISVAVLFDKRVGTHGYLAFARRVSLSYTLVVYDYAARREIGRGYVFHHLVESYAAVVYVCYYAVDDFTKVVRRYVGGKTYRYTRSAVDEKIGESARQYVRLLKTVVKVERERNRFFVEIAQHFHCYRGKPCLRITHCRRSVAVHTAEVAVSVYEHHTRIERLRKPYHRVVYAAVAVRMVFTEALANDSRRLLVRFVGSGAQLVHRIKYTSLNGFESVLDSRERSVENNVL